MQLKSQLKDFEINAMNNENVLRDEIDLLKDKNSKLMQAQSTLEVYKERLKEIPELKVKLSQALKSNLQFENQKNEHLRLETENQDLQEQVNILKERITELEDQTNEQELHVAKIENEANQALKQRDQMQLNMDEFNKNIKNLDRADSQTPDDLSLLKDENNLMTQRIKNMEAETEKLNKIIANYNPDSVKL